MIYDITTLESLLKSMSEYLQIPANKIVKYILNKKDEYFLDDFLDVFGIDDNKLLNNDLVLTLFHVTTNNDNCLSIKKHGLVNLQKSIMLDTPLSKYLKSHGIIFDVDMKVIHYKDVSYNMNKDYRGIKNTGSSQQQALEHVSFKLYEDYQINSFLYSDNVLEYGGYINTRPEFIYNISKLLGDMDIEYGWRRNSENKCYVVKFMTPISNCANTTFDFNVNECLDKSEIDLKKRKWIIKKSLSTLNNRLIHNSVGEDYCELQFDINIPYSDVIDIYTENEYKKKYLI